MDQPEYKLEEVKATRVAADDIDRTFRSSSIGESIDAMTSDAHR